MSDKCMSVKFWAGVCLATAICVSGCGGKTKEQEPHVVVENANDKIEYNFVPVEIGDVILTKSVDCVYMQQNEQSVSFGITGRLVDVVYVEEGDQVKKGMLLAELSAGNLEEQVEDLEYRIARNELLLEHYELNEALDRSQAWVNFIYNHFTDEEGNQKNLDAISESYRYLREDCEDALEIDRAKLAKVRQELASCRVYAQMSGSVYKLKKDLEGSTSNENEVIMMIVDNSQCLFEMKSPEDAVYFAEDSLVTMKIGSGTAVGEYTVTPFDRDKWGDIQQFKVLDGPSVSEIEVGTHGTIRFAADTRKQVLCVPNTAINSADGKYYVYVTDEDNMRQIRWVEVGLIGDDSAEIISGLEVGERVVRR